MNRIALSAVLVGLGAVAGQFVSSGLAEPTTAVRGPDAEKLSALRMERRDVLRQLVKEAEEAYHLGRMPYASITRININLLNAELELATDHAGRVGIRERMVEHFREIEKSIAEFAEAGLAGGSKTDLLDAKAARMQAEIDLLLETAAGKRSE
jgi:ribonuclease HII